MSQKTKGTITQNAAGKSTGTKEDLTPKQKHANWTSSKIEKAGQDGYNVISQKTRDSAEFVNLINFNDQLMYQLRMSVGSKGSRVTVDSFQSFLNRSEEAKELLNTINAELCRALGRDYRPPRGFKHPFKNQTQNSGQAAKSKKDQSKQAPKKATVTSISVATQEEFSQPSATAKAVAA